MKRRFILPLVLFVGAAVAIGTEGSRKSVTLRGEISNTTVWVLPHLFHIDPANTSAIQVTNHSATETIDLNIGLRNQAGQGAMNITAQVAPRATRNFPLDTLNEGFVGTAVVFCNGAPCLTLGTWEFDFGGSDQFRVGIPAVSAQFVDSQWATATFDPTGNFALAVFNDLFTEAACTLRYFNEFGDPAGTEAFMLPGVGQRADFASVPAGFVGRAEVDCDGSVWVATVAQSPTNGFPTYVRAVPTTVPE